MMEQYQSYASTFKNENIILKNAVFQKFMYNVYYYLKKKKTWGWNSKFWDQNKFVF